MVRKDGRRRQPALAAYRDGRCGSRRNAMAESSSGGSKTSAIGTSRARSGGATDYPSGTRPTATKWSRKLRKRPSIARERTARASSPRPGHPRYLVFKRNMAILDPRLAKTNRGTAMLVPIADHDHRRRDHPSLGGAHGDAGPACCRTIFGSMLAMRSRMAQVCRKV